MVPIPLRKSRKKPTPIPFAISFALSFLDEELTGTAYEREVRRIVREELPTLQEQKEQEQEAGVWEEYDARVSEIIAEELARN